MARFDGRKRVLPGTPGARRPALDRNADVQDVIDSLVSRLDAVQRRAFYEKMMQLDDSRPRTAAHPDKPKPKAHEPKTSLWLC